MGGVLVPEASARDLPVTRRVGGRTKLVLHFDINNTLLAADPVCGLGLVAAVNMYVAGVVWVRQATDGSLDWLASTLKGEASLNCPEPGFVTYYKFLERQAELDGRSRKDFKQELARFSETPQGAPAKVWVDRILQALSAPELSEPFTFTENGVKYHYILPSFWRLLSWLQEEGREFSIVLRTYGSDGPRIAQTIKSFAAGNHPEYPQGCPSANLAENVPLLRLLRGDNRISLDSGNDPQDTEQLASDECGVFEFFDQIRGTAVVQDDYKYWSARNYVASAGKPLWVPVAQQERGMQTQHILFDDNIRVEAPENSIADARLLVSSPDNQWKAEGSCSPIEAEAAGCLVQAALHQSAMEKEYFRDKVQLCERRWAAWTDRHNTSGWWYHAWKGCDCLTF